MISRRSVCAAASWLLRVVFLATFILALFADQAGLDPDQKWGPFRLLLLAVGLSGIGLPLAMRLVRAADLRLIQRNQPPSTALAGAPAGRTTPFDPVAAASDRRRSETEGHRVGWLGGPMPVLIPLFVVLALYVWFVSVGQITTWPSTTKFYGLLAKGFLQGQTDLSVELPLDLSEFEDPYHHVNLGNYLHYVVEFAYFRGKYYVYYGPAPALLIAPVVALIHRSVGDQVITFAGMTASAILIALILHRLRRDYFPQIPTWLLSTGVFVAGTAHPMLWMLSWAAVYPAAISCGQAFLLAGLLISIPSIIGAETRTRTYAAAGVLWGLALSTRASLVGAVAVLALASLWGTVRRSGGLRRREAARAIALLLPILVTGTLLAAYNYARFGNIFETGIRYSLNLGDPFYLVEDGRLFNFNYLIPNLVYYLVTPFNKTTYFPFIRPVRENPASLALFLSRFNVLETHSVERVTGLLVAAPFTLFAAILAVRLLCDAQAPREEREIRFRWLALAILLGSLFAGLPVLLYYLVNSRFLMDFSPLLIIGSVVGSWILYREANPFPIRRSIVIGVIILAIVATFVVSFLLAMTGEATLFDDYNPGLWQWLRGLASW